METACGTLCRLGGVAERSNAAVSKTVSGLWVRRGFKSLPLRSLQRNRKRSALAGQVARLGIALAARNPLGMGTLPVPTVTSLFSDVEGSTRPLHELGPER